MIDMFNPGRIGGVEIKNRIVRSATWEALADEQGRPTGALAKRITDLVEGEVGLPVIGITAVAPGGKGMNGMTGLYAEDHYDGHARLVEEVHQRGGKVCVQIAHTGAQTTAEALGGARPVAPSGIHHPAFGADARGLSGDEVEELVEAFGRATDMARRAGYDAVQIHGAHGYLVNQFMSPRFNLREDKWGAPHAFVTEVYKAVRDKAGDMAVMIKLNVNDYLEGSVTPEISLPIAEDLSRLGIDAIEASSGTPASGRLNPSRTKIESAEDEGYYLPEARMVKERVDCPVIGVGGYRSPEVIDRVLSQGQVDFVAISRPLIREPRLVKRWKEGDRSPARCESCNRCFGTLKYGEGIQCMLEYRERKRQAARESKD